MLVLPSKWNEKIIAVILVIAVMGILVPTVIAMAYQHYSQGRMLGRVDIFIKSYGTEMQMEKFRNIDKLFGYTGDGGRLGIIYHGTIDKSEIERYVSSKDQTIRVMYIGENR